MCVLFPFSLCEMYEAVFSINLVLGKVERTLGTWVVIRMF